LEAPFKYYPKYLSFAACTSYYENYGSALDKLLSFYS